MRDLTLTELDQTAGGFVCIDPATINSLHNKAFKDGVITSMLMTTLSGVASWVLFSSAVVTAGTAVVAAPYFVMLGYAYSSVWY